MQQINLKFHLLPKFAPVSQTDKLSGKIVAELLNNADGHVKLKIQSAMFISSAAIFTLMTGCGRALPSTAGSATASCSRSWVGQTDALSSG